MYHMMTIEKSIFSILIFAVLISFQGIGQTGYGYFDTRTWSKIDTIEFNSHFSLLAFEKDSLQEIRADHIGNSSSTIVFQLLSNQLSTVVIVTDDPFREFRQTKSWYEFSKGKLMNWSEKGEFEFNMNRTNSSLDFEDEENRILQIFRYYMKMLEVQNTSSE